MSQGVKPTAKAEDFAVTAGESGPGTMEELRSPVTTETVSTVPESLFSWGSASAPSLPSVDDDPDLNNDEITMLADMSIRSSTASLNSSIYKFIEENGRTYHKYKDGRYFLPNDATEQERLDIQHHLFFATFNSKLYLAPIPHDVGRVLDIATGTGIWAIDFAMKHPDAEITGTDLSPIQPDFIPQNCKFEIDDAEDQWTWAERFDYIHGRALLSCFRDPKAVFQQAFDNLAPGGYLELQDACFPYSFIGEPPTESYIYRWNQALAEALATKTDRRWDHVQHYKHYLEEIGFEDVVERKFYWPTSPWPKGRYFKVLAALFQQDMSTGIESSSLRVLSLLGWDIPKIKEFVEKVWLDFKNTDIHCYVEM